MMSYGYKLYQYVHGQELDRLENYSVLEKNIETLLKNEGKILKLYMKVPCLRNAFFFVVRLLRYMTESENHE